jgi:hypothetical protein
LSSLRTTSETRARVLGNARAAEWERLRNEAIRQHPGLSDAEIDAKARELQTAKLSAAGKESQRRRQARLDEADRIIRARDLIEARLEEALSFVRLMGVCAHAWPDGDPAGSCLVCGAVPEVAA